MGHSRLLAEAKRLGIQCADLRGTKDTRNPGEEGRFRTRAGLAVTTYSNLFNVNPIIQECDLLLFDDAHGGEQHVAHMWTVTARRSKEKIIYEGLLSALRPGLSDAQVRAILDRSSFPTVENVDVCGHEECLTAVAAVLDDACADAVKFGWRKIRKNLGHVCFSFHRRRSSAW